MAKTTKKKTMKKKTTKKTSKKTQKKTTKKAPRKSAKRGGGKNVSAKKATKGTAVKKTTVKKSEKSASAASQTPTGVVAVGKAVPAFTIHGTGGTTVSSESLKGKKVVLYFYPKDSTPGCTIEGRDFTRLHEQFQAANTEVFGVSRDDMKSHEKFKSNEGFCFELLSDESGELSENFGVWKQKSMYGRTYMGIERSTFLIDENGILRHEWRAVKVDGHAQEVLEAAKSLS